MNNSPVDVLVVGAGPTGLALASDLLKFGISCRIIDKTSGPSHTSKALGLHSRTLELFEQRGYIDSFLQTGIQAKGANAYIGNTRLVHVGLSRLVAPYPFVLLIPQSETEAILLRNLQANGGKVEWLNELADIQQTEGGVRAKISHADGGIERVQAKWLIGCDGASSKVRKLIKVPFEGKTVEELFWLADVQIQWDKSPDEPHIWLHEEGVIAFFPLPDAGQWRIIFNLPLHPETGKEEPGLERIQQIARRRSANPALVLNKPTWFSKFRIHERIVSRYRTGSVFLAGDAAHIHSPVGGQGMNTGIQDAYNLAWKLALVIQGKATDSLLDTYQKERMPIAEDVLSSTGTGASLMFSHNPLLRFVRNTLIRTILKLGIVQEKIISQASGLAIHYQQSSLCWEPAPAIWRKTSMYNPVMKQKAPAVWMRFGKGPKAGDRAPQAHCLAYLSREKKSLFRLFHKNGFTLLLFEGLAQTNQNNAELKACIRRANELFGNWIMPVIILREDRLLVDASEQVDVLWDCQQEAHQVYRADMPCLYLIRPDGYIAFRSPLISADELEVYARKLKMNV